MQHRNIREFSEGDLIEGYYAVREASLHMTTSGKPYIRLTLSDATGQISGNMWDGTKELFQTFRTGDIVKLQAQVETYKGAAQVKVSKLRYATPDEADPEVFLPVTPADRGALRQELAQILASFADPDYAAIARLFFDDPQMLEAFCRAPAAKENHHAYIGGLLEHTVCLARYADLFARSSGNRLNRDLLLCGTLLHDIGKTEELSVGAVIEYTDKGKLLGHLIIGTMMLEERAKALPALPPLKKQLVQHLILSHHGKFEYGSPVLPATPEALALHHIDNLDAKTIAARRIIDNDESPEGWTQRSWMLETRLFKGASEASCAAASAATPIPQTPTVAPVKPTLATDAADAADTLAARWGGKGSQEPAKKPAKPAAPGQPPKTNEGLGSLF